VIAYVFASLLALAGSLQAAQTNVTVVLTNQCQVTGFLVSQSSSNVVVSVGGGQKLTFAAGDISSLQLTQTPAVKSPGAAAFAGGQPVSGATSNSMTRITLALASGSFLTGVLVSQSSSNFVVSLAGGRRTHVPRANVKWFKLTASPAAQPPAAIVLVGDPQLPAGVTSNSIAAEFNQPHTEDEMRAMLRTPEGAALLKSVCDEIIGPGADAQTKAATESYFKTVQEFEDGKIGIVELQAQAQTALGKLNQSQEQINGDPQAARLDVFKQILQGFVAQPAPVPVAPVQ
jgi:hypothetical protein